ncbi:MAG: precorrin-2 C(20)-methyltransferase [Lachnospiraceae bacterium]|nr:precorrin-2 C(20)-methyltransferase [Lachnospiraceae bacterium]
MTGILYGVGVGPGDPELMTLKAVRRIRENRVIAVPGERAEETVAYRIAVQAVPELAEKELVALTMPMTHDREVMRRSHEQAAEKLEAYLREGENVVFLTLGDPTVYSTFSYVQRIVKDHGFTTELVSGIPSFCAAAARLDVPLVEWNEPLHVLPAVHRLEEGILEAPGNYVLMKSGRKMDRVKKLLAADRREVSMVENCGMENEHVYRCLEKIPDDAGYYSLIIAKEVEKR